jgi:hypothetical protein
MLDDDKKARVRKITAVVSRLTNSWDLQQDWSEADLEVLKSAREALGVAPDYGGPIGASIIRDHLAQQLAALVLDEDQELAVGERLAERGKLPKGMFRIETQGMQALGCLSSDVYPGIIEADNEEHLKAVPEKWQPHLWGRNATKLSLFVRYLPDHVLVTVCVRDGIRLTVVGSWRLYRDVVDMTQAKDPSEFFDLFLETYTGPPPMPDHVGWSPFGYSLGSPPSWMNVAAYNKTLLDHGVQPGSLPQR